GRTPTLHVGGVQEAVMMPPPRLARAVALLVPLVLVVLVKAITSGLVVLQVRGGLVRPALSAMASLYKVSTAVAVMDTPPPLFKVIEFPPWAWPPICRWIAWIRQVVYR